MAKAAKKSNDEPTVVLGAGSAGLTAAYELLRQARPVVVVEQSPHLGGLARSFTYEGFRLDLGPHAFHVKNAELTDIVNDLCNGKLRQVEMCANLLFRDRQMNYPLNFREMARRLDFPLILRMVLDYLFVHAKGLIRDLPEDSFEAWCVKRYGRPLYRMAFGNYSEKVWGVPGSQLSCKLAQHKIPDMSLVDLILDTLKGSRARQKVYYTNYLYPDGGTGVIFTNMARRIEQAGGKIYTRSTASEINLAGGRVESVIIRDADGETVTVPCTALISSIPLSALVPLLRPRLSRELRDTAAGLKYRGLILVYLVLDVPQVSEALMVYLLDERFRFNRFSEPKNVAPETMDPDKTILCFEICADHGDELWNTPDEELYRLALKDIEHIECIPADKIEKFFVLRLDNVYPIFTSRFDSDLGTILNRLSEIPNLLSIGKQGLFLNHDIHDSMEIGMLAARHSTADEWNSAAWYAKMKEYLGRKFHWKE